MYAIAERSRCIKVKFRFDTAVFSYLRNMFFWAVRDRRDRFKKYKSSRSAFLCGVCKASILIMCEFHSEINYCCVFL